MNTTFSSDRLRLVIGMGLIGLLSACGGGNPTEDPMAEIAAAQASAEVDIPEVDAAERRAMAALAPTATDQTRYIVTLDPAAVAAAEGRSAGALSAGGTHRSRTAAAVRSLALRTLGTHRATLHAEFSAALLGYAASVPTTEADAFVQSLAADPAVARIELDRVTLPTGSVSRSGLPDYWNLDRIDQRRRPLNQSYASDSDGEGVRAYIVDSGIHPHEEFGARLLEGHDLVGDGRGTDDCMGHGTHVAGTVGGNRSGVAPGVSLVPVRIFGCSGGAWSSTIIAGLDWVLAHGTRPAVVNLSLGGSALAALDAAAQRLIDAGFTVVVAAGNDHTNACTKSPGRLPAALTVAASTDGDARAAFSNYGSCVDLFAPGTSIRSASYADSGSTTLLQGTSMAAPHVAGAAAALLSRRTWMLPSQVTTQLLGQATTGVVTNLGSGSPNRLLYAGPSTLVTMTQPDQIHVDAIGSSARITSTRYWAASVTVRAVKSDGSAIKGAVVSLGHTLPSRTATCTTAADGRCTVSLSNLARTSVGAVTFTVTKLAAPVMTYRADDDVARSATAARP